MGLYIVAKVTIRMLLKVNYNIILNVPDLPHGRMEREVNDRGRVCHLNKRSSHGHRLRTFISFLDISS